MELFLLLIPILPRDANRKTVMSHGKKKKKKRDFLRKNRMLGSIQCSAHTCSLYGCVNILDSLQISLHTAHRMHLPLTVCIALCGSGCTSLSVLTLLTGCMHESLLITFMVLCHSSAKTNTQIHSQMLQRNAQVFLLAEQIMRNRLSNHKISWHPGL